MFAACSVQGDVGQIPGSIRGKYKNDKTQAERVRKKD